MITPISSTGTSDAYDEVYKALLAAVENNLSNTFPDELFYVDVKAATGKSLFTHYLNTFPESVRQQYFCHTCAEWLKQFGQLVACFDGVTKAVVFAQSEDYSNDVNAVLAQLAAVVERAPIVGIKHDTARTCAVKNDGKFSHFYGILKRTSSPREITLSISEKESKVGIYNEAHRVVTENFKRYTPEQVKTFSDIFSVGKLSTARQFSSVVKLFSAAHKGWSETKHEVKKSNIIWEALNISFVDFYHFNASVLGTFLSNLASTGEAYAISQFLEQTNGVNYKRPTTAPTEMEMQNAIKRAREEGLESGFIRRFAKPEDIKYWFWKADNKGNVGEDVSKSIFDGLRTKDSVIKPKETPVDGGTISFVSYADKFLPRAKSISIDFSPNSRHRIVQFTEANDPTAKNLHNYNSTVSTYMYQNGSHVSDWGTGQIFTVTGITTPVSKWDAVTMKFGIPEESVIFVVAGLKDTNNDSSGIFMENLRSEYRDLRRVIELYSNATPLSEIDGESAAGVHFSQEPIISTFKLITELEDGTKVSHRFNNYL